MTNTTAAVSTPIGRGGIAVIRISGPDAHKVAGEIFFPESRRPLAGYPPRTAVYGQIRSENENIDTGIAVLYKAPFSFTGEDTAEISCHGGILLAQCVLEAALTHGCEPAGPGEFTKRAFLNGKLKLSQAEGIISLIDASSREMLKLASAQSRGVLARETDSIHAELTRLIASVYAYIDYPDEDLTEMSEDELIASIRALCTRVKALKDSYRSGKAISEGVPTVICGCPNTGKSSLLNALLGTERAIVTDIPGTTRDTVEESAVCGKVTLKLCDTAGIRKTADTVERIGVERAEQKLEEAELILAVFDRSSQLSEEEKDILRRLEAKKAGGTEIIILLNKSDLPQKLSRSLFDGYDKVLEISASNGGGIDALKQLISDMYVSGSIDYEHQAIASNARQYAAFSKTYDHLSDALKSLESGFTRDVAGFDLELALAAISESDTRRASAEVVNEIFSRFCIGK